MCIWRQFEYILHEQERKACSRSAYRKINVSIILIILFLILFCTFILFYIFYFVNYNISKYIVLDIQICPHIYTRFFIKKNFFTFYLVNQIQIKIDIYIYFSIIQINAIVNLP